MESINSPLPQSNSVFRSIIVIFSDDSSYKGFDGIDSPEREEDIANLIESFKQGSFSINHKCGIDNKDANMSTSMTQKKGKNDTWNY